MDVTLYKVLKKKEKKMFFSIEVVLLWDLFYQ